MQDKFEWSETTAQLIDWPAFETAHHHLPYGSQTTMVKFRSRWLATRARLHLFKESPTAVCPLCSKDDESITHFLQCSRQADLRTKLYKRLETWLRHFNTPLKLQRILVSHLQVSLGDLNSPVSGGEAASDGLKKFERQQIDIGWNNLLCGFAASTLAQYMDEHLPEQANCDGQEWVVRLLKMIQGWVAELWHARCKVEHGKEKDHLAAT